jgi:hypothetical protein
MNKNLLKNNAAVCRWTGRIIGTFLALVILIIAIGQGVPNPFTQPVNVQVGFLALALMLIGILAGWKWELAGGITSIAGWCLFLPAVIRSPRGLNGFVLALALPGTLYVLSALLRRFYERRQTT